MHWIIDDVILDCFQIFPVAKRYGLCVILVNVNSEKVDDFSCHYVSFSDLINRNFKLCSPALLLLTYGGLNIITIKNMRMGLVIRTDILTVNQTCWADNKSVIVVNIAVQRAFEHDSNRISFVNGVMTVFIVVNDF